ncbi:hypothetical protein BdWA1_003246 [Babesia duncani]|uniref:Uncharacterized protein n=1 Tax=Babesia duncani TaxID=323732 RepID=A0AAD9PIM3_9APIC|nr:hypothetical protein BdWA1_003246 [Babesia duncani]
MIIPNHSNVLKWPIMACIFRNPLANVACIGRFYHKSTTGYGAQTVNDQQYASLTDLFIQTKQRERLDMLKRQYVASFKLNMRQKEMNVNRPPLLYEGPKNIRYWMRKRRSGVYK